MVGYGEVLGRCWKVCWGVWELKDVRKCGGGLGNPNTLPPTPLSTLLHPYSPTHFPTSPPTFPHTPAFPLT